MQTPAVTFAARTDVGLKRDHNEDNYLADPSIGLFVVCDGMGGHAAGEVASAIAVRTLHEEVKQEADLLQDYLLGKTGGSKVSKRDILNMLEFATNRASSKVHAEALADASKRGMGTTLVAVLLLGTQAFVVHVGDSRLYLLRNRVLEQLTEDHNVHNELVKRKKLSREEILQLAPKNAITRAVGVYESCEPDTLVLDTVTGDRFLLCTDGLSEYFEAPLGTLTELGQTLGNVDETGAAEQLVNVANARGGKDNITALVVTLGGTGAADSARGHHLQRKKQVLAQMPLFRSLDDRELRRVLQVTDVQTFQDGQPIVAEGDVDETMYIVLFGAVAVRHGDVLLKELTVGEHFGEMAMIRSQPRSATVTSVGPSELLAMHRVDFLEILRSQHRIAVKLLWQFTGVLAERLAETTRDLGEARTALAEELSPDDLSEDIFGNEDDDRQTVELPLQVPDAELPTDPVASSRKP